MTDLTRRHVVGAMPLVLSGCAMPWSSASMDVRRSPEVAAGGYVVLRDGEVIASETFGTAAGLDPSEGVAPRPFTLETPFRAASISKLAVALAAWELDQSGDIPLDQDVAAWLPGPFFHPQYPDAKISMRRLLSHTSGISDPEAYWVAAPGTVFPLMELVLFRSDGEPGKWFEYANINYGIAATVMERATGVRFDRLVEDKVLAPLGLAAGFNWSGMTPAQKATGATLYRRDETGWQVQTDGPEILADAQPLFLKEDGFDLRAYEVGTNGTLFSPQGGLRATLPELARLARAASEIKALTDPMWQLADGAANGQHEDFFFRSFGTGVHRHEAEASPWPGQLLLGHHGEAYGLFGGAWHVPGAGVDIAYAVTGTPFGRPPPGGKHSSFNLYEQQLFDLARRAAR